MAPSPKNPKKPQTEKQPDQAKEDNVERGIIVRTVGIKRIKMNSSQELGWFYLGWTKKVYLERKESSRLNKIYTSE